ncbi:uncharacterized protein PAF06_007143 [Gastrophryne carolinensis]
MKPILITAGDPPVQVLVTSPDSSQSQIVTDTDWYKGEFSNGKAPEPYFQHTVQERNWEKKLQQVHKMNSDKLSNRACRVLALDALNKEAAAYASAIKLQPKSTKFHFNFATVLEEFFYASEMYSLKKKSIAISMDEENPLTEAFLKYKDALILGPNNWLYNLHVGRHMLLQTQMMVLQRALALQPVATITRLHPVFIMYERNKSRLIAALPASPGLARALSHSKENRAEALQLYQEDIKMAPEPMSLKTIQKNNNINGANYGSFEKCINILEEKCKTGILKMVYSGIHSKPEDDRDLQDFFRCRI